MGLPKDGLQTQPQNMAPSRSKNFKLKESEKTAEVTLLSPTHTPYTSPLKQVIKLLQGAFPFLRGKEHTYLQRQRDTSTQTSRLC